MLYIESWDTVRQARHPISLGIYKNRRSLTSKAFCKRELTP